MTLNTSQGTPENDNNGVNPQSFYKTVTGTTAAAVFVTVAACGGGGSGGSGGNAMPPSTDSSDTPSAMNPAPTENTENPFAEVLYSESTPDTSESGDSFENPNLDMTDPLNEDTVSNSDTMQVSTPESTVDTEESNNKSITLPTSGGGSFTVALSGDSSTTSRINKSNEGGSTFTLTSTDGTACVEYSVKDSIIRTIEGEVEAIAQGIPEPNLFSANPDLTTLYSGDPYRYSTGSLSTGIRLERVSNPEGNLGFCMEKYPEEVTVVLSQLGFQDQNGFYTSFVQPTFRSNPILGNEGLGRSIDLDTYVHYEVPSGTADLLKEYGIDTNEINNF